MPVIQQISDFQLLLSIAAFIALLLVCWCVVVCACKSGPVAAEPSSDIELRLNDKDQDSSAALEESPPVLLHVR